ncbi:Glycosyltransferase involved in cell wall bisynthesis [Collimonas sp. OK242]|uniref:glycosyltransferase family 4 protein n=1 Tax=Collimonas sp. OK242 TaxID=1798195 RepID=UPI000899DEC2|nr:glycosyltransferase [Collimonas sp. OK242]SDX70611.1 Glycosyltransferase involved in cell wall bisynthesis [Collimonas sp. OK242]
MNIVHVIVGLNVGGAEFMLKRLIESHQGDTAYRHTVISLTDIGKVGQQLQSLGVEVQALYMHSVLDIPRVLWQLVRLIRGSDPVLVQTWMYHADLLGGLAARIAGNRNVIWGIRTTDVQAAGTRATTMVRLACACLSRWVPHTIVCAADASRRAHVAVGYDATRMVIVPNGFDLSRLVATAGQSAMLRARYRIAATEIVIGVIGWFNPAKDHKNFVRAAGLVAQQYPHARFLMVGRGLDASNAELACEIAQTGHADRFVLLAERADVPVCLAAMDIFCLSSRTEGFPNVVGEAMAMGVPCVVTDVGDSAMLIADTGIVVPKEDPIRLARGLGRLLAMGPDSRRRLGQEARERIHAKFTIELARTRFEDIYQRVAGKGER